jgi:predicted ribosomally synthesized peptide with nif11-like leader
MSENLNKFLEAVSKDEELVSKIGTLEDVDTLIAIGKDLGIELTPADFDQSRELDDEELNDVSGGSDVSCACAMGGGGTKDANDKTCACVLAGVGYDKDRRERCLCGFAGYGYDT